MNAAVIVLVGMPASGKSRVGRELAAALGVEHRDSDSLIESSQGRSIPEIFASDGEDAFRTIEEEVIAQALELPGVLSVGGGALISARTRERLRGRCVIYIEAELSELLRRSPEASVWSSVAIWSMNAPVPPAQVPFIRCSGVG